MFFMVRSFLSSHNLDDIFHQQTVSHEASSSFPDCLSIYKRENGLSTDPREISLMTTFIRKIDQLFLSSFLISREFFLTFLLFIFLTHVRTSVSLLSFCRNVRRRGPSQTDCKFKQCVWFIQMLIQSVELFYSTVGQFSHQVLLSGWLFCKNMILWTDESLCLKSPHDSLNSAQPEVGLNIVRKILEENNLFGEY